MNRAEFPPESPVDLSNCDREPIHTPSSVQAHGVLVTLREPDLTILQVSRNAEQVFGFAAEELVGRNFLLLLGDCERIALRNSLRNEHLDSRPQHLLTLGIPEYDVLAHRIDGALVLELEWKRPEGEGVPDYGHLVKTLLAKRATTNTVRAFCQMVAEEVRRLTGFDRVMVYQFQEDGSGAVIAEDREERLSPYLGLHYPASDIPKQARDLYTLNWLRVIPDVHYRPVELIPMYNPITRRPLDMSYSILRSVSSIHIQYLKNMGVSASMSISLLRNGVLWGLIACHQQSTAKYVPHRIRTCCEFLGQVVSLELAARTDAEDVTYRTRLKVTQAQFTEFMAREERYWEGLVKYRPNLLNFLKASGAAACLNGEWLLFGQTPAEADVRRLVEWLAAHHPQDIFYTDKLPVIYPEAMRFKDEASGLLAIMVSENLAHYILWFRPEVLQIVNWAGDPGHPAEVSPDGLQIHPRKSFELWKETVRLTAQPWKPAEVEAAADLRSVILRMALRAAEERLRRLAREQEARDRAEKLNRVKDEFLATLSHELRTPLVSIVGWARLLRSGQLDVATVACALETIERNARLQGRLVEDLIDTSQMITGKLRLNTGRVNIAPIVEAAFNKAMAMADAKGVRMQARIDEGVGAVYGEPDRLHQIAWNLLSNAVKFTMPGDRIEVRLERVWRTAQLTVSDTGQGIRRDFLPHVFERFRKADPALKSQPGGLGLGLAMVRHLVEMHGGTVSAESAGEGEGATFTVKLLLADESEEIGHAFSIDTASKPERPAPEPVSLKGVHVLVVDDKSDGRRLLTIMLEQYGAKVTAAATVGEALEIIDRVKPDVLVSDINRPSGDDSELILRVRARSPEAGGDMPAVALSEGGAF